MPFSWQLFLHVRKHILNSALCLPSAAGQGSDPVIVGFPLTAGSAPHNLRSCFACPFLIKSLHFLHSLRLWCYFFVFCKSCSFYSLPFVYRFYLVVSFLLMGNNQQCRVLPFNCLSFIWETFLHPQPPTPTFPWLRFVILIMLLHAAGQAGIHFSFFLFLVLNSWDESCHSLPQPSFSFPCV